MSAIYDGSSGPIYGDAAGCCCFEPVGSRSTKCPNTVTWAGHITMKYDFVPRAFACDEHRGALDPPPRPYGHPEHLAEMARRKRRDEESRRSYEETRRTNGLVRPWDG